MNSSIHIHYGDKIVAVKPTLRALVIPASTPPPGFQAVGNWSAWAGPKVLYILKLRSWGYSY